MTRRRKTRAQGEQGRNTTGGTTAQNSCLSTAQERAQVTRQDKREDILVQRVQSERERESRGGGRGWSSSFSLESGSSLTLCVYFRFPRTQQISKSTGTRNGGENAMGTRTVHSIHTYRHTNRKRGEGGEAWATYLSRAVISHSEAKGTLSQETEPSSW